MSDPHIPWISKKEIIERYSHIKPVVKKDGNLYWSRVFDEDKIFKTSYLFCDGGEKPVKEDELVPIPDKDFRCLHGYAYWGIFKPSIAEVLTQISPEVVDSVVAFEIIASPKTADDFSRDKFTTAAFNAGYHVSTVRLYKRS